MGPKTLNITRCLFCSKTCQYEYFDVCSPETSSCASKPILLRCKLTIPQCMCQVSLGLKEVQMEAHEFKCNKVPLFARKPGNMKTSMSAAPKLATVPVSRYYNLLRCKMAIPQCMCQVSLELKDVQIWHKT